MGRLNCLPRVASLPRDGRPANYTNEYGFLIIEEIQLSISHLKTTLLIRVNSCLNKIGKIVAPVGPITATSKVCQVVPTL